MIEKNNLSPVLQEFKEYIDFIKGLWASLSSISVLFPLSNALMEVIPIAQWPDGGFISFSKYLITSITTFICLFLVLWQFGHRQQYHDTKLLNGMVKQAGISISIGLITLVLYLTAHFAVSQDFYFNVLGWESDDMRRIGGDVILLFLYAGFFGFATHSFLLLAMREFLSQKLLN